MLKEDVGLGVEFGCMNVQEQKVASHLSECFRLGDRRYLKRQGILERPFVNKVMNRRWVLDLYTLSSKEDRTIPMPFKTHSG